MRIDTGIDDGHHYIVMEFVEGRSAAQLLRESRRLDPATATEIGVQASEGLDYAPLPEPVQVAALAAVKL